MEWRGQRLRFQGGAGTGFRPTQDYAGDLDRLILSSAHFDHPFLGWIPP
jgi:hypothetical protein